MIKKQSLLAVFLIIMGLAAFGSNIDKKTAARVARNFYYEQAGQKVANSIDEINITSDFIKMNNGEAVYYIFNINNEGFVIVAAEDNVLPVLGYSTEGIYKNNNIPVQFRDWAENYQAQILYHREHQTPGTADISEAWQHLSTIDPAQLKPAKGVKAVGPLLLSTWDQGTYYNELCPHDAAGPDAKVWAGCVATAMAQIMFYYRYPLTGVGSHSYSSTYRTESANFGTTTYQWDNMLNSLGDYNTAVSTLIYHCGVSVNMDYSPTGSGASSQTAANSLKNNFRYSSALSYKSKSGYTDANWAALIKAQIDAKKPVYYDGYGSAGGHAFVCDGYQSSTYFHFNWGWSGSYNGYFLLTNLNPGGDTFNNGQGAIIDITPGSNYPYNCTGSKTVTGLAGTLEDGSGPIAAYQSGADCYYLIAPQVNADDTITNITISFNKFDVENSNDLVYVYDGGTTSSPLIGTYSGSSLPADFTSSGNKILLHFTSNSSINNDGWYLTYRTHQPTFCSGTTTLTATTNSFSDGSGSKKYMNKSVCQWQIQPSGAKWVNLHFNSFALEPTNDFVEVYFYDTITGNGTLAGHYTGTAIPSDIYSTTGSLFVIFFTNGTVTAGGWSATYTSGNTVGINENQNFRNLSIFPNPAHSMLNVSFEPGKTTFVETSLCTLTGDIVYSNSSKDVNGIFNLGIGLNEIAKGIYFLKITTDGGTTTHKVVVQ